MKKLFPIVFVLGACATDVDTKGPSEDEDAPDFSGKSDSFAKPLDHGFLIFGIQESTALTDDQKFHAWEFELSGPARVELSTTYAVRGQRKTDTVLYLYKAKPDGSGWGSYIARNDDASATTVYSKLAKSLDVGHYRVLVKGFAADTRGKFAVGGTCSGDGCFIAPPASACLFGDSYYEIAENAALTRVAAKITPANLAGLTAEQQRRFVVAVQQSSHTDVMTAAEALDAVDQNECNLVTITKTATGATYVAYEYGVGDNSYGAIFDDVTGEMVTNIHDGDLENCTVAP